MTAAARLGAAAALAAALSGATFAQQPDPASDIADVLRESEPRAFFAGFGASSLDFEIHAFVALFDKRLRVQHEINLAVERELREHGIEI